jgi:hypothetical protein
MCWQRFRAELRRRPARSGFPDQCSSEDDTKRRVHLSHPEGCVAWHLHQPQYREIVTSEEDSFTGRIPKDARSIENSLKQT